MGENGTFYLTLPSNASSVTYPTNTSGNYKVKLVKEIFLLEDDWEVALASISFPNTVVTTETDDYKSLIGVDFPIGVEMSMDGVKDDDGNFIGINRFGSKVKSYYTNTINKWENPKTVLLSGTDLSHYLIIEYTLDYLTV